MKLSLLFASMSVVAIVACDDGDELRKPSGQAPSEPGAAEAPPPAPAPRTLVTGNALPTSPVNLIADPSFGTLGGQAGFGAFLAFDEATFSEVEVKTAIDSRSPAGFAGAVAVIAADGATSTQSDPVLFLTSFQGGGGPFHAKVWVSRSTLSGKPLPVTLGNKGIRATITDSALEGGEAFDLAPVEGSERIAGGRTWVLLRGEVTKPIEYGGFFVVRTGTGGGQFHVASPEIVAQPLVDGLAATRASRPALRARVPSAGERAAILRYKSAPPRLVPASAATKTRVAD